MMLAAAHEETPVPARPLVIALALAAIVSLPACSTVQSTAANEPQTGETTQTALPTELAVADIAAPRLPYRELTLPTGSIVTDHTERLAVYRRSTPTGYPREVLGVLDLQSGRSAVFLPKPVNARDGFYVLAPRISDGWVAWAEVSPSVGSNEQIGDWRLYAAPLDPDSLRVGAAILVDEGENATRSRARYALDGHVVAWASGAPGQGAEIRARDMTGADGRLLAQSDAPVKALSFSEGVLLVTEEGASSNATVRALDVRSGSERARVALRNTVPLSHSPAYREGRMAFAVSRTPGAIWPDQFLRDETGDLRYVGRGSSDPCFTGGFLFFGSTEPTGAIGSRANASLILGVDPATMERFTLVSSIVPETGSWQTVEGVGYRERTLVIMDDTGDWATDPTDAKTLIRVYDVLR